MGTEKSRGWRKSAHKMEKPTSLIAWVNGIAALDTRTGKLDSYNFGGFVNTGEPVFAASAKGSETKAG